MPKVNTTIDVFSPLITYSPSNGWIPGNLTADPKGRLYQDGTFITTTVNGSTASFSFDGTGIWLFGAKRGNHGNYSVTLDGNTNTFSGTSDTDVLQTPLFGASNLSHGLHNIVLTNVPLSSSHDFTDLDYVWDSVYSA
ncbi:hypothetical protein SCHPADRAFT_303802 [Schizopora paradoxa]|uniref:Uncharacterized protein n=1 Tax=Schizopora paradoxa TaxID=27342 RepID=A0A0H2RYM2_9AGAM|nr:hypothetical protein SCHPADRAFT_303802 [Schizopora paradoxa]